MVMNEFSLEMEGCQEECDHKKLGPTFFVIFMTFLKLHLLLFKKLKLLCFYNFRFQFKTNLSFPVQEKLLEVISIHTTGTLVKVLVQPVVPMTNMKSETSVVNMVCSKICKKSEKFITTPHCHCLVTTPSSAALS